MWLKKATSVGIGEEVPAFLTMQTKPSFVRGNSLGEHEICNCQQRALGVAICAVDINSTRLLTRVGHGDVAVTVSHLMRLWMSEVVDPSDSGDQVFDFTGVA